MLTTDPIYVRITPCEHGRYEHGSHMVYENGVLHWQCVGPVWTQLFLDTESFIGALEANRDH